MRHVPLFQRDLHINRTANWPYRYAAARLSRMIEEGGTPNLVAKYVRVMQQRSESPDHVADSCSPGIARQEDVAALALA